MSIKRRMTKTVVYSYNGIPLYSNIEKEEFLKPTT